MRLFEKAMFSIAQSVLINNAMISIAFFYAMFSDCNRGLQNNCFVVVVVVIWDQRTSALPNQPKYDLAESEYSANVLKGSAEYSAILS